jgi:hypothetical protein
LQKAKYLMTLRHPKTYIMNRILIILFAIAISHTALSQNTYITLGTGLNSYHGFIGVGVDTRITDQLGFRATAGVGGWGGKIGGGLIYRKNGPEGFGIMAGYSSASGLKNFKTDLETGSSGKQEVTLDLLRCGTFNISANRGWRVGSRNIFNLEFGYAFSVAPEKYYVVKSGQTLSPSSETVMKMLQPGGLLLSASFMFGLK